MPYTINAAGKSGAFSFPPAEANEAFERVQKLELQGFKNIIIKDEKGRIIGRAELAALCK